MSEAWRFRSGTLDQAIFNGVFIFNEYDLPECFAPGDIVVDIGAHIGSFAEAVLSRGCQNIYCIEADSSNVEIAAVNLKPHLEDSHVQLVQGARGGLILTRTSFALTVTTPFLSHTRRWKAFSIRETVQ